MNPVDRYIARATFGLPRKTRLDTAAELRVHLLQRVEELVQQGFSREEAEHLAIQRMGAPGPTWRRVVAGVFSRRVGWYVASGLALAVAAWLVLPVLLRPAPSVQPSPTTFDDVEPLLAGVRSFDVFLPEQAVAVRIGVQVKAGDYFESTGVLPAGSDARLASPRTLRLVTGALDASDTGECGAGVNALFVRSRVGNGDLTVTGCLPFGSDGVWDVIAPEGAPLSVNAWTPVVVFRPMQTLSASEARVIDAAADDGSSVAVVPDGRPAAAPIRTDAVTVVDGPAAYGDDGVIGEATVPANGGVEVDGFVKRPSTDPDTWLVVSLYASSDEIGTFTTPPPPAGADVAAETPLDTSL